MCLWKQVLIGNINKQVDCAATKAKCHKKTHTNLLISSILLLFGNKIFNYIFNHYSGKLDKNLKKKFFWV